MKTMSALAGCALAAGMFVSSTPAFSACGHDVHGGSTIGVTQLSETTSYLHYFSPAVLIMDNPRDPRHRAFGECRGQAITIDGVAEWVGSCIWKREDGDSIAAHWTASPSDRGTENRETLHGKATWTEGTGKLASLNGRTGKWSGLASGGSYFCDN